MMILTEFLESRSLDHFLKVLVSLLILILLLLSKNMLSVETDIPPFKSFVCHSL